MKKAFAVIAAMTALWLNATERELKPVTFACHWLPQAQFAGYYLAKDKGFYQRYGLDVNIEHASATSSNTEMLLGGKAQFASLFLTNAIRLAAENKGIAHLAQLSAGSSLILAARKSAGINSPKDINRKKLGLWRSDFQDIPLTFLKQQNIACRIIPVSDGIGLFLRNGIDILTVTSYNELFKLTAAGIKPESLTMFKMSDYGLNIPEEGIYCMTTFLNEHPDTCRNFVMASLEGWKYAFKNPEEAMEAVATRMREQRLPFTKAHQRWMLDKLSGLMLPAGLDSNFSTLDENTYRHATDILKLSNHINNPPSFSSFKPQPLETKHVE